MARKVRPKRRRLSAKRGGRFAAPALPVVLAGSAHKRPGDHVVGRPNTNFLLLQPGEAAVDAIADRLAGPTALEKRQWRETLRNAVLSAHEMGIQRIIEFNDIDRASRAAAALQALRALLPLVYEPTFIPAVQHVVSIATIENPSFGDRARGLAFGLEFVPVLEAVVADAQRKFKPIKRKNPGRPYMAGFAESLVAFWHKQTGEFPSKTHKSAKRSKSIRMLFWDFADQALADLLLEDEPIEHHVRTAIERLKKGVTTPAK